MANAVEEDLDDPVADRNNCSADAESKLSSTKRNTAFQQSGQNFSMKSGKRLNNTQAFKAESRATVLASFEEHRERRMAVKLREEAEKRKIMNNWLHEERIAREKQLRELFGRLSQNKQTVEESRAKDAEEQITERIERSRSKVKAFRSALLSQRASGSHTERLKTCMKRRSEIITQDIEHKLDYYQGKLEKADLVLNRAREYRTQTVQLNRERLHKKILRSRVQNFLFKEAGGKCKRHQKNRERYESAEHKESLRQKPRKSEPQPSVRSQSQPKLDKLLPDEVLVRHFNVDELRHIRDDLNYFITNKEERDKVTLFSLPQMDPTCSAEDKLRALSAQGEFNLTLVKTLRHMREPRLELPTRSKEYAEWLKKVATQRSPRYASVSSVKARTRVESSGEFETRRKRNLEAALHEMEARRSVWQNQRTEKLRAATDKLETNLQKKREKASARNKKLTETITGIVKKKAEDKAAEEVLQAYLMDVRQNYIEKQVADKVNNERRMKVMLARKEINKWKEKCQWISETARKKDVEELVMSDHERRKSKNLGLPRLPITSFSPDISNSKYRQD